MQKLIPILPGQKSVVPFRQDRMLKKVELIHLFLGDGNFCRVGFGVERTVNNQSGLSAGAANQPNEGLVVRQGLSCPVLADLAEEPMLDGIPLRGAGGIVTNGDSNLKAVDEFLLQGQLPSPTAWAVTAAAIGQDE